MSQELRILSGERGVHTTVHVRAQDEERREVSAKRFIVLCPKGLSSLLLSADTKEDLVFWEAKLNQVLRSMHVFDPEACFSPVKSNTVV